MERPPLTIQLELQPVGDSVRGRAVTPSGATREFAGWLGAVAALDVLLREAGAPPEAAEPLP